MARDWVAWHRRYDDPASSLSRRLVVVRDYLRRALAANALAANALAGNAMAGDSGTPRLISMCAGEGRDVLPVLATHGGVVRALLVESDPGLAERARRTAGELGLAAVEVCTSDAGITDAYAGFAPAHTVLACGVFGNIPADQVRDTVAALPTLLTDGGIVIWTRGRPDDGTEPATTIREWYAECGFTELAYAAPADASFRVGMHRLDRAAARPFTPGTRMFRFV